MTAIRKQIPSIRCLIGVVASVRWPGQQSFERPSMANGLIRACEGQQSALNQPLMRPAPPRRDDRYVAETVNSPANLHRPQRLQC